MAEQRFLPVVQPLSRQGSTPEDFGEEAFKELQRLGDQVSATTRQLVENVAKPRARQNAMEYQKKLALEVERITADVSSVDTWEEQFQKAKGQLAGRMKTNFTSGMKTYTDAVKLSNLDAELNLKNQKNAILAQEIKAAYETEKENLATDVMLATSVEEQDRLVREGAAIAVQRGVDSGAIFEAEQEMEEKNLRAQTVSNVALQYLAADHPEAALEMLNDYGDTLNQAAAAQIRAQAVRAIAEKNKGASTGASNERAAHNDLVQKKRAKAYNDIAEAIFHQNVAAGETGPQQFAQVTEAAIRALGGRDHYIPGPNGGSPLLTQQEIGDLIGMLRRGGEPPVRNVAVERELTRMLSDPDTTKQQMELTLEMAALNDNLPPGDRFKWMERYNTREGRYTKGLQNLFDTFMRFNPLSAEIAIDKQIEFMRWLDDHPEATPEQKQSQLRAVARSLDTYSIRQYAATPDPTWFVYDGDKFDADATRKAMGARFAIPEGQRGHLTEQEQQQIAIQFQARLALQKSLEDATK